MTTLVNTTLVNTAPSDQSTIVASQRPGADGPWSPPGPGLWERDPAHQERPFSRLWHEVASSAFTRGTAEAFERLGLPLAGMQIADINGWFYATMLPVADDQFMTRIETAEQALGERTWRTIAEEWHTTERSLVRSRNRELQAINPAELDDASLAAHTHDALDLLADAGARHFLQAIAHWVGVGLLINDAAELAGWGPAETIAALAGSSPGSTAPVAALRDIAMAIAAEPAAASVLAEDDDGAHTLIALRDSSPAVCQVIDAYMDEFGWQVFTGFDFTHQAMIELPSLFLSTLRNVAPTPSHASDRLAALRSAAPTEHRERIANVIDDAVTLYGIRDDDSGLTIQQPVGLARRALLEGGRRAAAAGRLDDADHIFDARRDHLDSLITGLGDAPDTAELRYRNETRRAPFTSPPLHLGSDEPPPDDELPPAMGTILGALLAAMSLEVAGPSEPTVNSYELRGFGASAGVYEGRARIVNGNGNFEHIEAGDILVATMTTPAYNVVLPLLGAVVTDTGGILCHAAIVAREFAIPAVVGVGTATTDIPDGARIRVDGTEGTVLLL